MKDRIINWIKRARKRVVGMTLKDRVSLKRIRTIDIEPIAACNLRCAFCPVPGWQRAKDTTAMKFEFFKAVVDQFPSLKKIKLQGMGEPLLNKDLPRMIQYAASRKIGTHVLTNGTVLAGDLGDELLRSGLSDLTFSIDGATKETYESVRRGADYDRVFGNIRKVCDLKKQNNYKTRINVVCLVSGPKVLVEVPSLIRICADMGVDKVHVKGRLKEWSGSKSDGNFSFKSVCVDDMKGFEDIMSEAKKLADQYGIKFSTGNSETAMYSAANPCMWPWASLYISTEGKVVPCCTIGIPETWTLGDLKVDTARDIWNNGKYSGLRRSIRKHMIPEKCRGCYK